MNTKLTTAVVSDATANTYRVSPDLRSRAEHFGGVLFDCESKDFLCLNRAGYRVFEALAAGLPDREVIAAEQERMPHDRASVARATEEVIRSLVAAGVLATAPGSRPADFSASTAYGRPGYTALRSPLVVSMALIFTCNLSCDHCYVSSTNQRMPGSWTLPEALAAVDLLAAYEVFDLVITGGEATLFPGFEDVIARAKHHGLYVALNTNGTTMTRRMAKRMREAGLDCAKVSIDSPRADEHNRFRQGVNAFEKTMAGVAFLREEGLRVDAHATLSQNTARTRTDVDALLDLADRAGIAKIHFGRVFSTGRAHDGLKIAEDVLDDTVAYLWQLREQREPGLGRLPQRRKSTTTATSKGKYDGCGECGNGTYMYLSYDHGLYPCTNLYKPAWKFGELGEDFGARWQGSEVLHALRQQLNSYASASAS